MLYKFRYKKSTIGTIFRFWNFKWVEYGVAIRDTNFCYSDFPQQILKDDWYIFNYKSFTINKL